MLKRFLTVAVAALALAGCADTAPSPVQPGSPRLASGQSWRIFSGLTPASTVDAMGGWEVGTRFYATVRGCVTAVHFYRAAGETGTNTVKLWSANGTLLHTETFSMGNTGWNTKQLRESGVGPPADLSVCISARSYYIISVNTNAKQVKTFGYLDSGPIVNGPLPTAASSGSPPGACRRRAAAASTSWT